MNQKILIALPPAGLALALALSLAPAAAEPNGRPPPIKLGTPSPSPSPAPAPIKIGKPAPSGPLTGVDTNQMIDVALKQKLQPQVFQWTVGQPVQQLAPTATHVCLLTGVSGRFKGAGEHVVLQVDTAAAGGARYTLSGTSGQPALRTSAVCVQKDRFTPGMYANSNVTHAAQPFRLNGNCNNARYAIANSGPEYGHFLREMVGAFNGDGEQIRVYSGSTFIKACSTYVGGAASSIRMIGSGQVKYYGPNGRTTVANAATFDAWSTKQANWQTTQPANTWVQGARYLAPVEQAICGLTSVSGPFGGYGEGAEIVMVQRDGALWWAAQVGNLGVGTVAMSVRCIARDQR